MERRNKERAFGILLKLLGTLAALPIFIIVAFVVYNGIRAISRDFITKTPQGFGENVSGGIAHAIVGTVFVMIVASFIGIPLGVLTGAYLSERKESKLYRFVERSVGALMGIPSVVVGLVVYLLLVVHTGPCAFAGGVSLALVMRPMVSESTRVALASVPQEIKEGGFALGAKRHQVLVDITIPAARKNVLVGIVLAVGRAMGEAAPILFTAGYADAMPRSVRDPAPTLPYIIYVYALYYPRDVYRLRARGASLILLAISLSFVYLSRRWRYERYRIRKILSVGR